MRTRLSIHIGILAFGLVLWQLQSVLAQKYYMNFAFNNNNPDANGNENGGGDSKEIANPGGAGVDQPDTGESGSNGDDGSSDNDDGNSSDDDEGSGDDNGDSGSGASGSGSGKDSGRDSGGDDESGDNNSDSQNSGVPGVDDDNDDSDSHDAGPRPIRDEAEDENGPDNDHSHHSSYEISIDDSFGGRYVRSIYESSESHGHSGSNAGSGSRVLDQADSSDSKEDGKIQTFGADDYEEYNED